MKFVVRLLATAVALWVAVLLVPGITYNGEWPGFMGVALVFGLLNAFIRPVLAMLTCPLVVLTLGLFIFVLNGVMLLLTSAVSEALGLQFSVSGIWAAILGAVIVGIVSTVLNLVVGEKRRSAS